jgi:hypothetical protein
VHCREFVTNLVTCHPLHILIWQDTHPLRTDAFMEDTEMSLPLLSLGGHMNLDAVIVSGGAPMKVTLSNFWTPAV